MRERGAALMVSVVAHAALWSVIEPAPAVVPPRQSAVMFDVRDVPEPMESFAPRPRQVAETVAPVEAERPRLGPARHRTPDPEPEPEPSDAAFDALVDGLVRSAGASSSLDVLLGGSDEEAAVPVRGPQLGGVGTDTQCADPIGGTWRARRFDPARGTWVATTLYIQRRATRLSGSIQTHSWNGDRGTSEPRRCGPGVQEAKVVMDGRGHFRGGRFRFDGSFARESVMCGPERESMTPTRASGVVRDGVMTVRMADGRAVRFRRSQCANVDQRHRIRDVMNEMGL